MNKEFVPHDAALAMKELGFDEDCFGFYIKEANNQACGGDYPCNGTNSAPLYQQAFRWFRKEYGLIGWVEGKRLFKYCIESNIVTDGQLNLSPFKTYEEAELACLRKLIEIVNQNKDDEK